MEHRLYYVRCVATFTGSVAERNLKDFVRQFDGAVCNLDGWRTILWDIQECNNEFNATHPRCTKTEVKYDHVGGDISMTLRNAEDNFMLLQFNRVKQFYTDQAVLKISDGAELAEEV